MNPGIIIKDPTDRMEQCINEKKLKTEELNAAMDDYISLKLQYAQKNNELLLTTNFKEVLNESKPTVAMKEAWIENQLFDLKTELNIAEVNVKTIKKAIEIINDEIKLWEYKCKIYLMDQE